MSSSWPVDGGPPPVVRPRERCPKCGRYYSQVDCPFCNRERVRGPNYEAPTSLLILAARIAVFTVLVITPVIAVDAVALWLLNLVTNVNAWLVLLLGESIVLMFFGQSGAFQRAPRGDGILSQTDFWISVGVAGVVLLVIVAYLALQ